MPAGPVTCAESPSGRPSASTVRISATLSRAPVVDVPSIVRVPTLAVPSWDGMAGPAALTPEMPVAAVSLSLMYVRSVADSLSVSRLNTMTAATESVPGSDCASSTAARESEPIGYVSVGTATCSAAPMSPITSPEPRTARSAIAAAQPRAVSSREMARMSFLQ